MTPLPLPEVVHWGFTGGRDGLVDNMVRRRGLLPRDQWRRALKPMHKDRAWVLWQC